MDDLISREFMKSLGATCIAARREGDGELIALGGIDMLPSALQWIPCSERLPEENLPVLVAVKQKDRLPKWVKEQTYSYVTDIDVYDDGDFDTHKNKVVAWMPLPEVYKGETDG